MQPQHELTGTEFHALWMRDRDAAITLLFRDYHTLVYSCMYRLVLRADVADDLTQELFLRILEGRRTVHTNGPLGSYLRRMAINAAIDHLRKHQPEKATDALESHIAATGTSADAGLHESDLNQALHSAIARLPERCATVFVLSRFEALSYAEIAEQLGISRNTVENQMVKALRLLRTALRDFLPVAIALAVSV